MGNRLPVTELVPRRPGLRAKVDDVDADQRVAERLVVSVGIQGYDRSFGRQRVGDVVAEELARADDQMQSSRILASNPSSHGVAVDPSQARVSTRSTTCPTRCPSDHHAGGSGWTGGPMETSTRLNGRRTSVPRTATGQMGTPACRAKCPIPDLEGT